jgi:putative methionine-R-sulfoxide reductase with GAF domain
MDQPERSSLLAAILAEFSCETATLHRAVEGGTFLELVSQVGVPDALLERVTRIPFGKGIAGEAAARKAPVTLCNLQQDLGGIAKPDARLTGVSGSLAVPILAADGSVLGVLGIGKQQPYEFSETETARLIEIAQGIGPLISVP